MELKPCPFCGSNDLDTVFVDMRDREGRPMQVVCADCGASGPSAYFSDDSTTIGEVVRVTAWNRRAAPEPAPGDRESQGAFIDDPIREGPPMDLFKRACDWIKNIDIQYGPSPHSLAAEFARVRAEATKAERDRCERILDSRGKDSVEAELIRKGEP